MRSRRSSAGSSPAAAEADDSAFAGWVYADVLLALFVVALAAVPLRFGADRDEEGPSTTTTTSTTTAIVLPPSTDVTSTVPPTTAQVVCEAVSVTESFELQIGVGSTFVGDFEVAYSAALQERGLAPEQRVGFVIAFRGPDIDEGTRQSRESMALLTEALPRFFDRSAWRGYGDRQLNSGVIRMEIFPLVSVVC